MNIKEQIAEIRFDLGKDLVEVTPTSCCFSVSGINKILSLLSEGEPEVLTKEDIVDLIHWQEFEFIYGGNIRQKGFLAQKSEEIIATKILAKLNRTNQSP